MLPRRNAQSNHRRRTSLKNHEYIMQQQEEAKARTQNGSHALY